MFDHCIAVQNGHLQMPSNPKNVSIGLAKTAAAEKINVNALTVCRKLEWGLHQ